MFSRKKSISARIIFTVVTAAFLILGIYSVITMHIYYKNEMKDLRKKAEMKGAELRAAIAVPLWYYDKNQIGKILESAMIDPEIKGIAVESDQGKYSVKKNSDSNYAKGEPLIDNNTVVVTNPVSYSGEKLGTIKLFLTRDIRSHELFKSIFYFAVSILVMGTILALTLYFIFSKMVIDPLKKLEAYSLSVSGGKIEDNSLDNYQFYGEMESLRNSFKKMLTQIKLKYDELQQEVKRFRDSEQRFRILLDTIPDFIWLKNDKGIYLACNKAFEKFTGLEEKNIIGKTNYEIFTQKMSNYFKNYDQEVLEKKKPVRIEQKISLNNDDKGKLLDITKVPVFDADKELIGVLSTAKDISEKKKEEKEKEKLSEQINQMQKIESIGRLAGGVAHDFNNMLGVILGHAELVLDGIDQSDPSYEHIREIIKAAERSADITKQLLAFARKQAIVPQVINLNEAVKGMLKMLKRFIGEDIYLDLRTAENIWPVRIDSSQLDQILANLCVNARDSITNTGKITIETSNIAIGQSYAEYNPEAFQGDFVMLSVSDTGCGMDKELISYIFEPFYTTKEQGKGTGLGLSTVYGIVKQNDGFISVYSEPGTGTVFKIYLPRYQGEDNKSEAQGKNDKITGGSETILLVEDEASILDIVKRSLEKYGYRVIATSSPEEAIEKAKTAEHKIDLIITDVIMPDMNGSEMLDRISEVRPGIRHLFMSGYTSDIIAHHGVLDPGRELIQKPFSNKDLAMKVREILDRKL
ncbi:MAG: ATP-binding protein [Thermodesulfobacteriota bacterium]